MITASRWCRIFRIPHRAYLYEYSEQDCKTAVVNSEIMILAKQRSAEMTAGLTAESRFVLSCSAPLLPADAGHRYSCIDRTSLI